MRFVVLTGLSGAGKSNALHALEDIGFYCVDNLPPALLCELARLCEAGGLDRVAAGIDIRGGRFFQGVRQALEDVKKLGIQPDVLFMDARDEELIRRYSETRRAHPLGDAEMVAAVRRERELLGPILGDASRVIDTSRMLTRELRETIVRLYGGGDDAHLRITVLSFGFKRGVPQEADLVLDVRFMPNPYYIPAMRDKTGLDQEVKDYIRGFPESREFLARALDFLGFLIPGYQREGKSRLAVAIGCTGGQHRSVFLAEEIAQGIREKGYEVDVVHRDKP